MSDTSDVIVGIDLGTTHSLVAFCDEAGPQVRVSAAPRQGGETAPAVSAPPNLPADASASTVSAARQPSKGPRSAPVRPALYPPEQAPAQPDPFTTREQWLEEIVVGAPGSYEDSLTARSDKVTITFGDGLPLEERKWIRAAIIKAVSL